MCLNRAASYANTTSMVDRLPNEVRATDNQNSDIRLFTHAGV